LYSLTNNKQKGLWQNLGSSSVHSCWVWVISHLLVNSPSSGNAISFLNTQSTLNREAAAAT